jgi:hypothetical protein
MTALFEDLLASGGGAFEGGVVGGLKRGPRAGGLVKPPAPAWGPSNENPHNPSQDPSDEISYDPSHETADEPW